MRIWLATIGEPVPMGEGEADRLHRTGGFARFLADRGHSVLWWTSAFDHFRKRHLCRSDETVRFGSRLEIRLLHGRGYRRNVSFSRLADHGVIAEKFAEESAKRILQERPPEIFVAALPSIELGAASADFGADHNVPVVLDMRDMWPDIFVDAAPAPARPVARALLHPMFREARRACSRASAITGITEQFVDWGLARGCRSRTPLDRAFPLAYSSHAPSADAIREAEQQWRRLGVARDGVFTICFFGSLSRQLDLMHAIDAARLLSQRSVPVRFVICGSGERLVEYRAAAAGLGNVLFPGWVDRASIYALLRLGHAGLDPLPGRYDFLATINNKAIEYLSAGLPILSSPVEGVLAELLRQENCGLSYPERDARSLADLIELLLRRPEWVAAMRQNSAALFRQRFDAENVHLSMESHLERIATHVLERDCAAV